MSVLAESRNRLYYGDNLDVLRKFVKDESVDLCYIDPPFNSKKNYNQIYNNIGEDDRAQAQAFTDTWEWDSIAIEGLSQILNNEHGQLMPQTIELIKGLRNVLKEGSLLAYLVSMTLRIAEIHRVLQITGSFYLHCDPTGSHYLKMVMDVIFGVENYRNEIIWKRSSAHSDSKQGARHYGRVTDTIFFYSKSKNNNWNQQYIPYDKGYIDRDYRRTDKDGRRYRLDNIQGPGGGEKGNPYYEVMGVSRYWRYSKEKMGDLIKQGRIIQSSSGAVPQYKRYLDEMPGMPIQNLWDDIPVINNRSKEKLGYPTQKPEALLERIIKASSNEGDTILDAYCGCGTTVAVAQKLNRRWIGIDITYQSISLILKRLEDGFGRDVLATITLDGIPKDMDSATALAHKKDDRLRKEFEKWAVLSYSNNRATINQKKGADEGIDGVAYFMVNSTENEKIIFQVKSGNIGAKDIRDLRGTIEQERASLGIFITLKKPTAPMVKAAHAAGIYKHIFMGRNYDRIQLVTIKDMIEKGSRLEMPLSLDPLKSAKPPLKEVQLELG